MDADYKQNADYYDGTLPYTIVGIENEHRYLLVPQGEKVDLRKTKGRILDLSTGKLYRSTPITQIITQGGPWHEYSGGQGMLGDWLSKVQDLQK